MGLHKKKIDLLREFVDYKCEECGKHEKNVGTLEPHRIRKGRDGGEYNIRNIKMVCHTCHDIYESADRIAIGNQSSYYTKELSKDESPFLKHLQ